MKGDQGNSGSIRGPCGFQLGGRRPPLCVVSCHRSHSLLESWFLLARVRKTGTNRGGCLKCSRGRLAGHAVRVCPGTEWQGGDGGLVTGGTLESRRARLFLKLV